MPSGFTVGPDRGAGQYDDVSESGRNGVSVGPVPGGNVVVVVVVVPFFGGGGVFGTRNDDAVLTV